MTRIITERFDYWPMSTAMVINNTVGPNEGARRSGVACAECPAGAANNVAAALPSVTGEPLSYRQAFRLSALPGESSALWRLSDATGIILELTVNAAGKIEWWDPVSASHPPGSLTITAGTYFVVEVQLNVAAAGKSTFSWRVNGVAIGSGEIEVRNAGVKTSTMGNISSAAMVVFLDDFAVNNAKGEVDNTWLGLGYPAVPNRRPVGCYQGMAADGDVYSIGQGDAPFNLSTLNSFESHQGRKAGIIHFSDPWESKAGGGLLWDGFGVNATATCFARGAIPLKSIAGGEGICAKVLAGEFDASIKTWAEAAKAFAHPFFLRPWWEMNGTWWNWSTTAAQFVEAWQYLYNKIKPIAPNVTFVWCPNVLSAEVAIIADFGSFYPGDAFVDWIGLDGYSGENPLKKYGWRTPAAVFKPSYDRIREVAPSKPIIICETACSEIGGTKSAWITELLGTTIPVLMPAVKAHVWFNWNITAGEGRLDWQIESSAPAQAAYKAGIASPYYLPPSVQEFTILQGVPPPPEGLLPIVSPPAQIVVQVVTEGGSGRGFDLSDEVEGLSFTNSNPGGDEFCSFTLHRSWFAENPEVGRGDILRVIAGIDVLWTGRIEDTDRSTGDAETIGVTAYGLGNRFADVTFAEIYVDRDLSRWEGIPNERVEKLGNLWQTDRGSVELRPTGSSGRPAVALSFSTLHTTATIKQIVESWYDAAGIPIGAVVYDMVSFDAFGGGYGFLGAEWFAAIYLATSPELPGSVDSTANLVPSASGTLTATTSDRAYAALQFYYTGISETLANDWRVEFHTAVFGRHGMTKQGASPGGFTADQIVGNIVSRASHIQARNVSSFGYVIPNFTVLTPVTLKTGIEEVSQYASVDYGVWGPNSVFDRSVDGYFDYTAKDTSTQHWTALRSDFEADLTFHSETGSLYDTVNITYQTEGGKTQVETFSTYSPDLARAGLSPRTYPLNVGTTTKAGARIYAEIFLDLFAGFAPARGSGSLTGSVRHYRRGRIPAYYMRADGANVRVPDILPAETTFALSEAPDRRTTFPIKRVTVDCSGDMPRTTVEFDQSTEALASLLAQEAQMPALVGP